MTAAPRVPATGRPSAGLLPAGVLPGGVLPAGVRSGGRSAGASGGSAPPLVAVAHGTRNAAGVAVTRALAARVRALRPGLRVELAHLDLVEPSLPTVLAGLRGRVVVVPLLLGAGYHVRADIPAVLAAAPRVTARVARALGPDPLLADALGDHLAAAGRRPGDGPVVLAAAGSTDPRANADAAAMAVLLRERLPDGPEVVPAYLCAAGPTPAEAVAALRAEGHARVSVAGYLLSPGFFADRAARSGGSLLSAPLGTHEAVARLVLRRYDEARAAGAGGSAAVRGDADRSGRVRDEADRGGTVRDAVAVDPVA
ncbi:sirohydrochlorin chelatase [Streptomyces sp. NPDC091281]|uniref:sirohydrochlorin chelatase n=1 Tax=Streptomyces sp. NPDC091281 TaxID=3365985 RepID=UPI0037F62704